MPDIVIDGIIGWDVLAEDVRAQLKKVGDGPIDISISSPGGSVFEGLAIYNLIKSHKGETTSTITGLAASMASYIALAADNVHAHENSVYMIHNASTFTGGDHRDLRKTADRLEALTNLVSRKYVSQTGQTSAEIRRLMDDETFLFGEEIKEAGFVDKIIEIDSTDAGETNKAENVELARMIFDDCVAKMKAEEKPDDLEKAAALFNKPGQKPTANHPKEEDMDLTEFLDKNPKAKAEHEALLAAKAEKVEAPAVEVKPEPKAEKPSEDGKDQPAANESAVVIAKSDKYPSPIRALAVDVVVGSKSQDALDIVVAMFDAEQEKKKSAEAQSETAELGETPAAQDEPTGIDKEGVITSFKGLAIAGTQIKDQHKKKGA